MIRHAGFVVQVIALILLAVVGGCRKPTGSGSSGSAASYDPRKDPLVNPPAMFEPVPADAAQVESNETLFLQLDGSPNTLNPLFLSSHYESLAAGMLSINLYTWDKDFKWRPNEEIVESFHESEDHTTFTVKMKPGFTWHDGTPFNAHDVVYSWQQILDPQVPCMTEKAQAETIKECVATDDLTVRYVFKEPLATSKWNLSFPLIPKHIFEKDKTANPDLKTGEYYNQQNRHPVGNGSYHIVEWKENDKIVMERWESYKGNKPYFKRIVFRIIPDHNVSLLSFEKEDIDVYERLTAQQFARETAGGVFSRVGHKAWGPQWAFGYIGWNMDGSNPFFADIRVRKALTHALNIPMILDKIYFNLATPCYGIFHPDSWMYNPEVKPLEFDPTKSAALLDEAGWKVDPGDGWRYKEVSGSKVRFEFTLLIPQGSPTGPQIAAIFQEELKRLGVELKTRILEWATFMEKVQKHEFQAEVAAWGTGTDPDTNWNLWRTEEYKTGRNYGGYSNPRVDRLFELARKEFDFDARKKLYQEIHKLIYDDQPYIWIYNAPTLAAFNKRIRGVVLGPRGIYGFDPSVVGWWVAKGQAKHTAALP